MLVNSVVIHITYFAHETRDTPLTRQPNAILLGQANATLSQVNLTRDYHKSFYLKTRGSTVNLTQQVSGQQ